MRPVPTVLLTVWLGAACAAALPARAEAFCGFYVSGASSKLYNEATQVVLMRRGTTTVLSMQNHYKGPPKDFALVVPVPQVLKKSQVRVLEAQVFAKIDALAAPRLVEYHEQDPCYRTRATRSQSDAVRVLQAMPGVAVARRAGAKALGVRVEAKFAVGEYQIVILSARESTGLERYLRQEKYNIPPGAAALFRPYIQGGQYFFVAKVNPKKVRFQGGQAMLSPLRFHYDSKDFQLPVRLGLINARGKQDLIVHILAQKARYEVANRPNIFIPTNLIVDTAIRDRFAEFYAALFDETVRQHKGAVVTEYAWQANNCDPCPTGAVGGGALNRNDIYTLGGDVLERVATDSVFGELVRKRRRPIGKSGFNDWVLTRLHARYGKADLSEDLIFAEAEAVVGGRGTPRGPQAELAEQGAAPSGFHQFQARYIMVHRWRGDVRCQKPRFGVWGGSSSGA